MRRQTIGGAVTNYLILAVVLTLLLLSPIGLSFIYDNFYNQHPKDFHWENANFIAVIISGLATSTAVAIAAFSYFRNSRENRQAHENQSHNELNNRYVDFLKLCLQYSDLGVQDFGEDDSIVENVQSSNCRPVVGNELTFSDYKKKVIVYEILYSLMERAFITYGTHDTEFKKKQWKGWDVYIKEWLSRKDFLELWNRHLRSDQYDSDFSLYIEAAYSEVSKPALPA